MTSEVLPGPEWPLLLSAAYLGAFVAILAFGHLQQNGRRPATSEIVLLLSTVAAITAVISIGHLFQYYLERAVSSSANNIYESIYGQAIVTAPNYLMLLYTLPYSVLCAGISVSILHRTSHPPSFLILGSVCFFVCMSTLDAIGTASFKVNIAISLLSNAIAAIPLSSIATTIYFFAPNFLPELGKPRDRRLIGIVGVSFTICAAFFLLVHLAIQLFLVPTSAHVLATLTTPFALTYDNTPDASADNVGTDDPTEVVSGIAELSATTTSSDPIRASLDKGSGYEVAAIPFSGCSEKAILDFARNPPAYLEFTKIGSFSFASQNKFVNSIVASASKSPITVLQLTQGGGALSVENEHKLRTHEMIVGTRTLKVSDSKFLVATYRWFNARVEDGRVVNEPTKFIFAVDSRRFELSTTPLPTRPRERIDCQFDRRNIDLNSTGRIEMPMKWGLGVLLLFQSMRDAPIGADRPAVTLRIPQGWVSTKFEANDLTQLPMIMGIRTIAITRGLGSLEIDNQERRVSRSHLMIATGTDLALEPTTSDGMRLIGQVDALSVDNVRALNTRWELLAVGLQALLLTTVSTLMVFLGRALWQHFPSRKGTWTSWRQ